MTQYRIVEAKCTFEFVQHFLRTFDVHQHIVRLVNLLDREFELTPTPVFLAMYRSAGTGNHAAITLDHRGHLLTLVRVDQKHNFVMLHTFSLWDNKPPESMPVEQGVQRFSDRIFGKRQRCRKAADFTRAMRCLQVILGPF